MVLNYHITALLQLDNVFWLVFRGLVSPDCLAMSNDTKPIKLTRVFDDKCFMSIDCIYIYMIAVRYQNIFQINLNILMKSLKMIGGFWKQGNSIFV
jgi:hypothetical protein